jgi:hypothetical protein
MEDRDIEKTYTKEEFVSKLRRLADCIEKNENFRISVDKHEIQCRQIDKNAGYFVRLLKTT